MGSHVGAVRSSQGDEETVRVSAGIGCRIGDSRRKGALLRSTKETFARGIDAAEGEQKDRSARDGEWEVMVTVWEFESGKGKLR
jgi:hypothetical protein